MPSGWLLLGVLVGCRPAAPPVPVPGPPPEVATGSTAAPADPSDWLLGRRPEGPVRYQLRWQLHQGQRRHSGRATVWFTPPDSLRFEYRGPLRRSGTALIVGDRMAWSEPRDALDRLVPVPVLLWAALGIPRPPWAGARVSQEQTRDGDVWRYHDSDTTLTYLERRGPAPALTAGLRARLGSVGTTFVALADSTGLPIEGRVWLDRGATLVSFTIQTVDRGETAR